MIPRRKIMNIFKSHEISGGSSLAADEEGWVEGAGRRKRRGARSLEWCAGEGGRRRGRVLGKGSILPPRSFPSSWFAANNLY